MHQELRLPYLPPSEDEYWDKADKGRIATVYPVKCDHHFIHRTSIEVICPKCKAGYFLDPLSEVLDGHIYHERVFVI